MSEPGLDFDATASMLRVPPLGAASLRWRCDPERLGFLSTADVEPVAGVIGQETAVEALRFGLACRAPGQNVFVRGLTGTGRMTLVRRLLEEMRPARRALRDRCYVHSFAEPDRPRLLTLAAGSARAFRRHVDELADFIGEDLRQVLDSEGLRSRRSAIDATFQEQAKALVEPLERAAREAGLALVSVQTGPVLRSTLFPVVDDKPVPPEELERLRDAGTVPRERFDAVMRERESLDARLRSIDRSVERLREAHVHEVRRLVASEARGLLIAIVSRIATEFPQTPVAEFLTEVVEHAVENCVEPPTGDEDARLYRVNIVVEHAEDAECPIIVESSPTMTNLVGGVDREVHMPGLVRSDHLSIRAGSLLRADGGFFIMEIRDVLQEPGAWRVLVRTLRTSRLEVVPPELPPWLGPSLKPEPIPIDVKVILIGDAETFYLLDALDPDFGQLFKLLADFESEIPRDERSIAQYAGVLARIAREENLPPFDRTAVAALVEHGARIAARSGKLTARFARLADLAREAAFIASGAARHLVTGADVRDAVGRTKRRAELPSRHFREMMADGTILVRTRGRVVGQINGLAVLHAGPLTSGFPARISATIGPGSAGVIHIDREAALSGAIHTKGFYILRGLLRHLLQTDHPLAFDASVAFEQSYGEIDGDSASGAEICCLLSALTGVSIRQEVAITGAIDQHGNFLAVGAVNEKIEGFFDVCRDAGLTGEQGVVIPRSNAGDLMLREDVVEACVSGRFNVWAIDTVQDALTLLTGVPAGQRDHHGLYPDGTLLALAVEQAHLFWLQAAAPGAVLREVMESDEGHIADEGSDGGTGLITPAPEGPSVRSRRRGRGRGERTGS